MKQLQEKLHGFYTVSNAISYGVIISDCQEQAKVVLMKDEPEISEWLDIKYVESEDNFDEDGFPELEPVIDPDGFDIPLNLVMRLTR